MEEIAQSTDARRAWDETNSGDRLRLWCKDCRDEGREWLTPKPCEHIQRATAEMIIPRAEAMETFARHVLENQSHPTQQTHPTANTVTK